MNVSRSAGVEQPIRDLGSFANFVHPSDADLIDHRSQGQNTVYIGVKLPKHHKRRHHKQHHGSEKPESYTEGQVNPSQRIQFLLGDDEDDEAHQAHELFCELDVLHINGDDMEWKETARWIKFEEDVEEGGERWSKPHVATLSLHSLFELRCFILNGTVLLDMNAVALQQVFDMVLDSMIATNQLALDKRDAVRDTLLSRHHHQHEKRHKENGSSKMNLPLIRSLADIGKKYSEPRSLNVKGVDHVGSKSSPNFQQLVRSSSSGNDLMMQGETEFITPANGPMLPEVPSSHKINLHFMKKIPQGAEASNILVGEVQFLNHPITAFVRLSRAIILGDLTEVPVPSRFIFILLGPMGNSVKYHEIGRSIATLMSDEIFHDVAYHAKSRQDLLAGMDEFLDQVTVLPPGEWDPTIRIEPPKNVPSQVARKTTPGPVTTKCAILEDEDHGSDSSLIRTGRVFGGLVADIKRKLPFYTSDYRDCLNVQCLASFIYLYFACLTPIITFGGLLGDATGLQMAAFESILAGSICGVVYAMFAGQPLTILGSTGPVLIFETIVYTFCDERGFDYLGFRVWIGIWTGMALIVIVAFDLSALVRFITRFTEESFSALISLIFIYESFMKLIHINDTYPLHTQPYRPIDTSCVCAKNESHALNQNITVISLSPANTSNRTLDYWSSIPHVNCTKLGGMLVGTGCDPEKYTPDVFLCSILIFIATFSLAMTLKHMRNSRYFRTIVRHLVSDFSVVIAIGVMVGIDLALGLPTPKLKVPEDFKPTSAGRSWFISPIGINPWYMSLAAIIPSVLATILIFMDQQITAVIVNRKENKLVKNHGYHLDLLIVALLIILCSLLGLPWFVAATVLSITHVMSLKKKKVPTATLR